MEDILVFEQFLWMVLTEESLSLFYGASSCVQVVTCDDSKWV